ncbi:MAG: aminopeptidase P family protein [Oscillospiraceae bacterium]|nr:aminopeptidase P family protein [Oscillospiraceae bacterium]
MRAAKDEGEVRVMAEAARIADLALRETLPLIGPRTKEHEVASELEYRMRKAGAQGRSFETIVASSFRAALPHGTATDRIIGDDACLVLDFGAIYEGYCSDITRTIFLGDPGPELERIYGIVLAAQEEALKAIKAGVPCRDADAAARGLIAGEGYGDAFWHSLGHGVGLEIHEAPRVSGRSDDVLATGMVITVEPGIYVEGLGGVRTENAVVVLEGGYRDLTGFGKALTRI